MADETTTTAEPTTRDVLVQIDKRLTRVEEDLRQGLRTLNDRIDAVRRELSDKIDRNYRWTVGLILVTWIATITTVFLNK